MRQANLSAGFRKYRLAIASIPLFILIAGLLQIPELRHTLRVFKYEWLLNRPLINGVPRETVDCQALIDSTTMIAVTFGQSNSANFANARYQPASGNVYSFHDGNCYRAIDPMPGASGGGGSVWTHLGDKLLNQAGYQRVIFATVGEASSEIARWSPNGDLFLRLLETLRQLRKSGLEPTHLLWHQGEADAMKKTSAENYQRHFRAMVNGLRREGIDAPVYISIASYCYGEASEIIRIAQTQLIDINHKIYPGPNTDNIIGMEYRFDDCHFSARGLEKFSDAWLYALSLHPN